MFRTFLAATLLTTAFSAPAPAAIVAVAFGNTYAINEVTGRFKRIGSFGDNSASQDAAGFLVTTGFDEALWNTTLVTADQSTDTLISSVPLSRTPVDIRGLAVAPSGTIYAVENGGAAGGVSEDDILIEIDPLTGAVTTIGTMPISAAQSLEFDLAGRLLVSSFRDLYEVDPTNAALTPLLSYGDPVDIQTLFSLPDGRLLGGRGTFYELDEAAGTVSPLFSVAERRGGLDIRGAFFDPDIELAPVPLPGAGLALLTALAGLGAWRRWSATRGI